MFISYKFGVWKKEIRKLLRQRLMVKDKIRYHRQKADDFEKEKLPKIEEELNLYLKKAGN